MSKEQIRVRYGRPNHENRIPKNTLVTVRQGDVVYFGIARCNKEVGDTFRKTVGTHIATQRADLVRYDDVMKYDLDGEIKLHASGLRGCVSVDNMKDVVAYFRNIDSFCYEKALENRNRK